MANDVTQPTFSSKKELLRYISETDRNGSFPAASAFIDPPNPDSAKAYLSVNSLELEGLTAIARYYRARFQEGSGDVCVASHKVFEYTETAKKCGIGLAYDRSTSKWMFELSGKALEAFQHHPVSDRLKSPSHCGVHFTRAMKEHEMAKFARRMAGKRFHTSKK